MHTSQHFEQIAREGYCAGREDLFHTGLSRAKLLALKAYTEREDQIAYFAGYTH